MTWLRLPRYRGTTAPCYHLLEARRILGWDIRVLAYHLGVNRDSVSKVERGIMPEFRRIEHTRRAQKFIRYAFDVRDELLRLKGVHK